MANLDNPFGFRMAYTKTGAPARLTSYKSTAAIIYPGDTVKKDGSGRILSADTLATDIPMGVAASYAPAVAGSEIFVYDDLENTVFEVQVDDGSITDDTQIGNFFDLILTTGNTTTLQSKQEMDGNASVRDNLVLVGLVDRPENAWGTNCNVYVQFVIDANASVRTVTA